ncbi:hypothetical protein LPJ61_002625 [Coemansia biformis]|uniref:Uncharacterized protein n=1 Tax=Coemansia biformis TaxID=1286918 RepID=A0A9W7YEL3_9FUNG|nr:hypothetical protein LPJ61_002625 [Coemansia biformis]
MELSAPSFKLGATVVLAYPDDTRLAGYRAALALWTALAACGQAAGTHSTCAAAFGSRATVVVQPLGVPGIGGPDVGDAADAASDVSVVFANLREHPGLTFCFVNGLPAPAHVPELVDHLVGLLEKQGVERVVAPAAANVSIAGEGGDGLWALFPASPGRPLLDTLADVPELPAGALTNDAFLSALGTIAAVAAVGTVGLLIHGDRRPGTSGYRERVVFGAEFADDGDAAIVGTLARRLAAAVDVAEAAGASLPTGVEVVRVRLDADAAGKGRDIFS